MARDVLQVPARSSARGRMHVLKIIVDEGDAELRRVSLCGPFTSEIFRPCSFLLSGVWCPQLAHQANEVYLSPRLGDLISRIR